MTVTSNTWPEVFKHHALHSKTATNFVKLSLLLSELWTNLWRSHLRCTYGITNLIDVNQDCWNFCDTIFIDIKLKKKKKTHLYWSETPCIYDWRFSWTMFSYMKMALIEYIFLPEKLVKTLLKRPVFFVIEILYLKIPKLGAIGFKFSERQNSSFIFVE